MSRAKIVGIHGGKTMSGNTEVSPLPTPLIELRDDMKLKLKGLLQKLFESADDALFAMADKAGTNGDQALYFDAMRELRLQKKTVATELLRGVIKSYNELGHYRSKEKSGESDLDSLSDWDNVSLVQNDDLELNVAMEGMISRLRNSSESHLNDLKLRIESLIPGLSLTPDQVPLSPEILCDCFSEGCNVLDVGIQVRLVVLKLFEKYVLSEIVKLYIDSNQSLVRQGIMPNLKTKKGNVRRTAVSSENQTTSEKGVGRQSAYDLSNNDTVGVAKNHDNRLQEMAKQVHEETGSFLNGGTFDDVPVLNADQCLAGGQFESIRELMHLQANGGQAQAPPTTKNYTQNELLLALSGFQQKQLDRPAEFASNGVIDYRMLLNTSLPKQSAQTKYSELDSDVINLVSMLFEFILDDRQLQPVMKALISRLQIPILKVAILDRNFFDRGGHPARKLLNEIASAAIGWNEKPEGKPDRLKDQIEVTVQSILTDFDNDQSMFTDLLADFSKFMDLELRRGQLVEQRTKDSERGKAANDVAKQEVQNVLNASLKGIDVPTCVVELLNEAWSRLMVLRYLKEGKESEAWCSVCNLVADVVWTVLPQDIVQKSKSAGEASGLLLRKIPSVMRQLRTGLKEISFDNFRAEALFKSLESEHIKAIQYLQKTELDRSAKKGSARLASAEGKTADSILVEPVKAESTQAEPIIDTISNVGSDVILKSEQDEYISDFMRETQEMEDDFKHFQALSKSQRREESENINVPEPNVLTNVDAEATIVSIDKDVNVSGIDDADPFVLQVLRFAPGGWFEFESDDKPERCKLAAIIKATGKYIFVNRSGVKVAEKTKSGLAIELKNGTVQVLNDGLLFDRALESVIDSLRGRGST
jgi:hypothetical protein